MTCHRDAIAEAESRLAAAGALVLPRMSCTLSLPGHLLARAVLHVTGYKVCIHFVYLARVLLATLRPHAQCPPISDLLSVEVAFNPMSVLSYRLSCSNALGEVTLACCNATTLQKGM